MFFKLFDEYERRKFAGSVTPPNENYIINKILHDQMCIYKFIVSDDGESLIYWAKISGVYPTSVPRDSFSSIDPGEIKFSISFKSSFVEDMDPIILQDFNNCVKSKLSGYSSDIKIYDKSTGLTNGEWCNVPYIAYKANRDINTRYPYLLKWR